MPATTRRSNWLAGLVLGVILLGAGAARAQTPLPAASPTFAPTPTPTPAPSSKPKVGYLRFWNMLPRGQQVYDLYVSPPHPPQSVPFVTADPLNYDGDYRPLPVGAYPAKVFKSGETDNAVKEFNLPIREDVFMTVLVQEKDGHPTFEALNDTIDPKKSETGKLTVRNYFPDARVMVIANDSVRTQPLQQGETATLEDLPPKVTSLTMRATDSRGKVLEWSSAVDFASNKHASVLVIPDPYGRFRPRLAIDGQIPKIDPLKFPQNVTPTPAKPH